MARVMQTTYRGSVSLIVPRRLTLASVVVRYRRRRTRTSRTAMLSAAILLTIVCAISGQNVNETRLTEKILKRITPLADTATKALELISPLGVDKELVEKITTTAKTAAKLADDFSYIANVDGAGGGENPVLKSIEESPDYASSVVLASDLLSLTTAVANVKERACREQGYKFLDGLLQNKRWALKTDTATKALELISPLGVDKELVEKITTTAKTAAKLADDFSYIANVDGAGGGENPVLKSIEESPDYASSVVLASDLLSLTTAVANVKERACREQGYKFLDGLLQNKRWALKMFDASAKSPQGLLFGSSYHLGNFDECVGIDDRGEKGGIVEGEYCLATIKWRRGEEAKKERFGRGETLRWAVCVPSSCSARAVSRFVGDVLTHTVGNGTAVIVTERDCYARRPISVDTMDISYLSFMMGFIALLILCSVYEIYTIALGKEKRTVTHELIVSFSLINNIKKIISTKQNNDLGLECISGIKSLAMIFIVAGHACMFIGSGPVMDAEAWDRLIRHPANSFMLSNTLLVDTFLMLSAFLFCRLLITMNQAN
ncbi:Nose resistant to fluoxetine protein 6 [Papilio machaon]|uniref:Nose resistant to fluoxetine protein 6 n=1 Tax=Papilio machaon TaxID=76193 RepID=A0A194R3W4_PAPMA|nr:Nose resistant to fluoxetine protein 6 [Papilio machaon]